MFQVISSKLFRTVTIKGMEWLSDITRSRKVVPFSDARFHRFVSINAYGHEEPDGCCCVVEIEGSFYPVYVMLNGSVPYQEGLACPAILRGDVYLAQRSVGSQHTGHIYRYVDCPAQDTIEDAYAVAKSFVESLDEQGVQKYIYGR